MALHRTEQRVRPQMSRQNRVPLADRVAKAAEAALAARHFVSAIDILVGIGWLDLGTVEGWRRGQIDCLEEVVRANLPRISEALRYSGLGRPREDCSQARRRMSVVRRGARRCVRVSRDREQGFHRIMSNDFRGS